MSNVVTLNLAKRPLVPGLIAAVVVVIALLTATWFGFTRAVGPDQVAIRQVYFGPGGGVQKTVLGPGLHLVVPGYETLHTFPRDMQVLEFNSSELAYQGEHQDDTRAGPAIRIQTSDGYNVTVDVTVLYRIEDPYTVVTRVGFGRAYEDTIVMKRADKILREKLGTLIAEDFFSDKIRMAAAEEARKTLEADLHEWGIQVFGVLVRSYGYDERFQGIIEGKKIEDQRKFKNQAEGRRERRKAERNQIVATWDADITVERQSGDNTVRQIKADADTYYRSRVAEGNKAVELARADGLRWERRALEAAGAANLVGIEMAKTLDGIEIIVISTTGESGANPLDLDALMEGW